MKKLAAGIIVGIALGAGASWFMSHRDAVDAKPRAETAPATAEKPKENPLHLVAEKRKAIGLTMAKPETGSLQPEASAYGRVLDPAPFIALMADLELARAALAASTNAATRARELYAAGGNGSRQNLETAEAAEARDRATMAAARARMIAGFGRIATESNKLAELSQALEQGRALARLDVPAGQAVAEHPVKAKVGSILGDETIEASILGDAPVADSQVQGRGFLALLGQGIAPIGAALRATLPGVGEPISTLLIPSSAVVYHQGSTWVYVLGEEDTFERKLVTAGRTMAGKVAVSGIEENDQVVTTGAGLLLSAELQAGGAPEEK